MQLRLIVVRDPRRTLGEGTSHVITEAGGTVGRNSSCSLVLADVANVISSRHAEFTYNGRGFLVTDTSTNGVYLNRTDAPLGRGNSALLGSGDVLYLGDLVFKIEIGDEQRDSRARIGLRQAEGWTKAQSGAVVSTPPAGGLEGFGSLRPVASGDPLAGFTPSRPAAPNAKPSVQDPLAALNAPERQEEDLLAPQRPAARQPFELPPFPSTAPRPTLAAARQAPSNLTFPGPIPSAQQPAMPPSLPPDFAALPASPNERPVARPVQGMSQSQGPIPDLNMLLPEAGGFGASPNLQAPIPSAPIPSMPKRPLPNLSAPDPLSANLLAPNPPGPDPFVAGSLMPGPLAPIPPTLFQPNPNPPILNPQSPNPPIPNAFSRDPLPPALSPLASFPQESPPAPGAIPDDFLSHLSGIPGFPNQGAAPVPPAQAVALPQPPAQSIPLPQPSPQPVASAPQPAPIGQRPPLPPDFAASLVTLGRKEPRAETPFATPSLDPVSVLRRRGEGRLDADATRSAMTRLPPPAPRLAPTPAGGPPSPQASRAGSEEFAEFWRALGLDPARLDPARRGEILQTLAALIRASVDGLVEVLSARSAIKDEFRMDRTRLQPDENNPLKFFRTGAEALHRSVVEPAPGFLPLDAAARSGFSDIKAHEVASMTALQNSMMQLFQRLAPTAIEQAVGQSMFGRKPDKAKLWDQYVELYNRFADTLEFSVPEIVATEFARVYHEQIEQMNRGESR